MESVISIIIAIGGLVVASIVAFVSTGKRLDEKIEAKVNDCIPRDLTERFGSVMTDLANIKESLSEMKADLKSIMKR
jgi:hypothetical protein